MYLSTTTISSQVLKNGNYLSILRQIIAFSVVSHCIFVKTCILLKSPFHAELNGICFYSVYIEVSVSYDCIIKCM